MKALRDLLYSLFKRHHIQRWKQFLEISSGRLRIALYIVNHGNRVHPKDIIVGLTEVGGDPRSSETIKRLIRYMKADGFIKEDREGYLSVKNPVRFIIKQGKRGFMDSWFLTALAVAISATIINYLESGWGTIEFLLVVIAFLIALRIVDDWMHETTW